MARGCLGEEDSRELWKVLRGLLVHYARVAVDYDGPEAAGVARSAIKMFYAPKTDRKKEVERWADDEKAYKHNKLTDAQVAEGVAMQHGIRDRFFVLGYEDDGTILVRVNSAKKQLQVFKATMLHGRCLREAFAGQTFVALRTTLVPWGGGVVCLGCETVEDFEDPGQGGAYGYESEGDICGSEFADEPQAVPALPAPPLHADPMLLAPPPPPGPVPALPVVVGGGGGGGSFLPPVGGGDLLFDLPMPSMEIGGLPNLVPQLPVPDTPEAAAAALAAATEKAKAAARALADVEEEFPMGGPTASSPTEAADGAGTTSGTPAPEPTPAAEAANTDPPAPFPDKDAATPAGGPSEVDGAAPVPPVADTAAGEGEAEGEVTAAATDPLEDAAREDMFSLRVSLEVKVELGKAYLAACENGTVMKTLLPQGKRDAYAADAKKRGNEWFKKKDFGQALGWYRAGLRAAPAVDLCSNAALMALKMNDGAAALDFCNRGLGLARGHLKCTFRKVQALVLLGLPREADTLFATLPPEEQSSDAARDLRRKIDALRDARSPARTVASPAQQAWWADKDIATAVMECLTVEDLQQVTAASKLLADGFAAVMTSLSVKQRTIRATHLPLTHLTSLSLEHCTGVNDVSVSVILTRCRALTALSLRGCLGVTKRSVDELLRHVKLQQPRKGLLPGMPQSTMASLTDLPPLPGMPAAGAGAAEADPAAAADDSALAAAPPQPGRIRKARRARHREALYNTPVDAEARVALASVDLSHCDQIPPTPQLATLALALDLTTTCLPSDYYFSPSPGAAAGQAFFIVAPRVDYDLSGALDVDGRFLFHNKTDDLRATQVGPFAVVSTLPQADAQARLAAMGLVLRADLTALVR